MKFGLLVSRQNQFNQTITSWACHLEVMVRNGIYNGILTMRPLLALRFVAILIGIAATPAALAAPCAGFTDVDTTSAFCPNVDWLKNRAVTLGCTSATLYCPGDLVSRLSMAAFMNRLGVALTPAIVYNEAGGGAFDLDTPPAAVCQTASIASATFPRAAHAGALLTAQLAATPATVALKIVQSIDNGVNLDSAQSHSRHRGRFRQMGECRRLERRCAADSWTSYRFGLRVERASGGGTGDLTSWSCQLRVMVSSRTGTSSPY